MKYLKIKKNKIIYLFESEDEIGLKQLLISKKIDYKIDDIKFLSSNVFKIKKGKNKELHSIFSN